MTDWKFANLSPSPAGIIAFHKIKWKNIVILTPNRFDYIPNIQIIENTKIDNLEPELLKFTPPIIQDLIELSVNGASVLDFERKVNLF